MKKVAIISELNDNSVNFGNRLQAYALNIYINSNLNIFADSIIIKKEVFVRTQMNLFVYIKKFFNKIFFGFDKSKLQFCDYDERLQQFNRFMYKKMSVVKVKKIDFLHMEYNYIIVGSDVVWAQTAHKYNKIKFLDFPLDDKTKKISYAASFGRDWIPRENKDNIIRCLKDFDFISVREKSTVKMLSDLGINDVAYVCDPTLLLDRSDWKKIEKAVNVNKKEKYIFTYILSDNKEYRDFINMFAKNVNAKIVNIPYANGFVNNADDNFGDYKVLDCSPEQWIWLIDNAEYVFTDSFHGLVFSTIFEKKFFVLKRNSKENINNRMLDFLNTIDSIDKYIDVKSFDNLYNYTWNYNTMKRKIEEFKEISKKFLKNALK